MLLDADPTHLFNHPIVVELDPFTYGQRGGEKIHVKAICYSLVGPIIEFPGRADGGAQQQGEEKAPTQSPVVDFGAGASAVPPN